MLQQHGEACSVPNGSQLAVICWGFIGRSGSMLQQDAVSSYIIWFESRAGGLDSIFRVIEEHTIRKTIPGFINFESQRAVVFER